MEAEETKSPEETHWAIIVLIILATVVFAAALNYAIQFDKQKNYDRGYSDGQNSVTVKYSFHGTVQYIDATHRSFVEIGLPYDCKLYQNDSEYGCKWLTDTLKVELTTK